MKCSPRGVVSIFEDVFVLAGILGVMLWMNWKLALITFAVLPLIIGRRRFFATGSAILTAGFAWPLRALIRICRSTSVAWWCCNSLIASSGPTTSFEDINRSHMEAYKDAIMAYAVYYPAVDILSSIAIACVIWFGGGDVMRHISVTSVAVNFNPKTIFAFHLVSTMATLGVLVAFIQYAQRFFRPIQDFSEKYNILQSAMAASERIFKLLDTPVQVVARHETVKERAH